jgi:hypothetical protein
MPPVRPKPAAPSAAPAATAAPAWLKPAILALAALTMMALFSREVSDADSWFHFAMGKWVWQNHKLPVPDPFGWTTYLGRPAYPGEAQTRDLNLRHEWLGQVILYLVYSTGGPAGMVLFRAACVSLAFGVVGWVVYRRTGSFYAGLLAAFAGSTVGQSVAADRPFVISDLLLVLLLVILEQRRHLWLIPLLFVFWANLHGAYFIGWVLLGAYCGEALILRLRGAPPADERVFWGWSIAGFVASGLNPTFFGIIPGMLAYRQSTLQQTLREWHPPSLTQPSAYLALLIGGAIVLVWARRRARPADWLMFLVFGAFSAMALRNVIFIGLIAPLVIFSYVPVERFMRPVLQYAAAALVAAGCVAALASGRAFQLRAATWQNPDGAIEFLKRHNVTGRMFNIYEWGGYLNWALWPQEKTFIDGRALNESVFHDYFRIAYNFADAQQLLDKYGVDVLLVEGFEYGNGTVYRIAPALSDPGQTKWKLVYQDKTALLFMRQPPAGVQPLDPGQVFTSLNAQCQDRIQHQPALTRCALGLGDLYARLNRLDESRQWLAFYLSRTANPEPAAERLYQQIQSGTFHAPATR